MAKQTPAVLVATLGRRDVQLLIPEANGAYGRFQLHRDSTRRFHQDCQSGRLNWRWQSSESTRSSRSLRTELDYVGAGEAPPLLCSRLGVDDDENLVNFDCTGGVELCTPIIDDLIGNIERELPSMVIQGALLVMTEREDGQADEPIAVGEIVRKAMMIRLGLETSAVTICNCLPCGDLYETSHTGERLVRGDVAKRIDDGIRLLRKQHGTITALISDVGGMPALGPVLAASARYRFNHRILYPLATERELKAGNDLRRVSPDQSLSTRHLVEQLIQIGAFDAAAKLSMTGPKGTLDTEPWRGWLSQIADAMVGMTQELSRNSDRYPSRMLQTIGSVVMQPGIVLTGFRIEAALQREDIPTAFRETFTFHEGLQNLLICSELSKAGMSCLSDGGGQLDPKKMKENLADELRRDHAAAEFLEKTGKFKAIGPVMKFCRKKLKSKSRQVIRNINQVLQTVREDRNRLTHDGNMDDKLVVRVRQEMVKGGLWARGGGGGSRFLDRQLIQNGFELLQEVTTLPHLQYAALLNSIVEDMDEWSFRG